MEKVKLTNEELVLAFESLSKLSDLEFPNADFDFHYSLAENVKEMEKTYKTYQLALTSIYKSNCKKDEKGNMVIVKGSYTFDMDKSVKVEDEVQNLLKKSVTLNLNKIEKKDFKGVKGISNKIIVGLMPLFK